MKSFNTWLQDRGYQPKTIKEIVQHIEYLHDYFESEITHITYQDLIAYVEHLQQRLKTSTINQRIQSIKRYYDYLLEVKEINHHPSRTLQVKAKPKNLLEVILKPEQLTELYETFEGSLQHKVLLSLIIFQGAESGTLQRMRPEHINLDKGTVYLPSTTRANSRTLTIHSSQLMPLFKYLQLKEENTPLFKGRMSDRLNELSKLLKSKYNYYQNIRQLRSSVIVNWLRLCNLRESQYRAGHRYISSTEKYCLVDMEKLKNELSRCHPFGD